MTDADYRALAKRLRDYNLDGTGSVCVDVDCEAASSAILALLEERDKLVKLEKAAFTSYGREQNANHALQDRLNLSESRLGRAMEALRQIADYHEPYRGANGEALGMASRARYVLSDLENSDA